MAVSWRMSWRETQMQMGIPRVTDKQGSSRDKKNGVGYSVCLAVNGSHPVYLDIWARSYWSSFSSADSPSPSPPQGLCTHRVLCWNIPFSLWLNLFILQSQLQCQFLRKPSQISLHTQNKWDPLFVISHLMSASFIRMKVSWVFKNCVCLNHIKKKKKTQKTVHQYSACYVVGPLDIFLNEVCWGFLPLYCSSLLAVLQPHFMDE